MDYLSEANILHELSMEDVMATHSFLPQLWREDQHPLRTLRQEMDDIFESWSKDLKLPEVAWPRTEFWPRVNISETDKEMLITAELPGVDQKDIEVTVSGNQLVIKGEKKSEVEEKKDEKGRAFQPAAPQHFPALLSRFAKWTA